MCFGFSSNLYLYNLNSYSDYWTIKICSVKSCLKQFTCWNLKVWQQEQKKLAKQKRRSNEQVFHTENMSKSKHKWQLADKKFLSRRFSNVTILCWTWMISFWWVSCQQCAFCRSSLDFAHIYDNQRYLILYVFEYV